MSWSLSIDNGDLSLEGGSYVTCQGGQKLIQDMMCWTLEPIGNDPMHLDYGSVIDGGILPSGEVVPSPIGETDQNKVAQMVETEIQRIVGLYKTNQLARITADNTRYGRSTLTPDEVIQQIDSINITLFLDGIFVNVTLSTYAGQTLNLSLPIN
jgi:hypothetical protein